MVDVFDEVDEQIRAERFRALVRRTVPYFIGALIACVAVVVGIWAYGQFSTAAIGKASLAYAKGMDLDQKGDADGAFAQFALAAKGPAGLTVGKYRQPKITPAAPATTRSNPVRSYALKPI